MGKVYFDGKIMGPEEATVPLLDRGLLFGEGAFETLRSYDFRFFRLDEHIERLFRNLKLLRIELPMTAEEIKSALRKTLKADNEKNANVKLIVTAGEEGGPSRFYVYTRKLVPFPETLYQRGVKLVTSDLTRNEKNITTTIKSLSYLDSVWARRESLQKGGEEGFFLNSRGCVSEGASSNIFLVRDGIVRTPSLDQGVLPGVTRSFVLELATSLGIPVQECVVTLRDMKDADEVFITASIKEVMPVSTLDGGNVGKTREITQRLHAAYRRKLPELCRE